MVVWIEGTPDFNSEDNLLKIDEVMTCKLPQDPDLREMVRKLQTHTHALARKVTLEFCWFSFPRKLSESTRIINSSTNDFFKNGGCICMLKHKAVKCYINNYNPSHLKLWRANLDIQSHISKSEPTYLNKSFSEAIKKIRREETDISRKLLKICMYILNEWQVSACEAVYR